MNDDLKKWCIEQATEYIHRRCAENVAMALGGRRGAAIPGSANRPNGEPVVSFHDAVLVVAQDYYEFVSQVDETDIETAKLELERTYGPSTT